MPIIRVDIPGSAHDFIIEPGAIESLGGRVREVAPHNRALLALDDSIATTHGARAGNSLEQAGFSVTEVRLRADEGRKSLAAARAIYDAMLANGFDRRSPVIAMGGGIVGDTAGFAAATFMRGVPLVPVPTTLLAMVDASIGGKTGVNLDLPGGQLGKNLVGSFHQPRLIVADPATLRTLDARQLRCGLAESIKHGLIGDAGLLNFIAAQQDRFLSLELPALVELIERSARVKVAIVTRDERESGERALLNLGHTFAHAIESLPALGFLHGEAVAIGLVAAAECACRLRLLSPAEMLPVRAIIRACGLPDALPPGAPLTQLAFAMQFDKKSANGRLRLVLPVTGGGCRIIDDVPTDIIESAWREVGAE